MTLAGYEGLHSLIYEPIPVAPATTKLEADYPDTAGLTTQAVLNRTTSRLELHQLRIVQNGFRRITARSFEEEFYARLTA